MTDPQIAILMLCLFILLVLLGFPANFPRCWRWVLALAITPITRAVRKLLPIC